MANAHQAEGAAGPLRILHVTWRIDPALGGGPAAAIHMARAEAAMGIDATVAATRATSVDGPDPAVVDLAGIPGLLFRRDRFSPYSYSGAMRRWLRRHIREFDLVEIHGVFNYPCLAAGVAARRSATAYVLHPHGQLDPFDLRKHPLLKQAVGLLLVRPLVARAQRVLTASDREARRLETYGATARSQTLPLPYLVSGDGADGEAFRAKYGLLGRRIVLFLGRIDYKKGLTYLIEAFSLVLGRFPDAILVLGGDDHSDYAAHLKERVLQMEVREHVRFLGTLNTSEKNSALAVASVLTLVSDNENYGLVLIEGAWWGVPMVISKEVYIAPILQKAGAALVVDRDAVSVEGALTLLLGDDELRRRMGNDGRKLARTVFSWTAVATKHAQLREELVTDRRTSTLGA